MLKSQRHRLIIDLLDDHLLVTVQMLTSTFKASEATIRRDLVKLAKQGRIKKEQGAAQNVSPRPYKMLIAPNLRAAPF